MMSLGRSHERPAEASVGYIDPTDRGVEAKRSLASRASFRVVALLVAFTFLGCGASANGLGDPSVDHSAVERMVGSDVSRRSTEILSRAMADMNAAGAGLVILEVNTGEIEALISLSDPARELRGFSGPFHLAVHRVHELGGVISLITIAHALDVDLASDGEHVAIPRRLPLGDYVLSDWQTAGEELTPEDIFLYGSTVGAARLALMIGEERQREFFVDIGLLAPCRVEQALGQFASVPAVDTSLEQDVRVATAAYGHGFPVGLLSIAAAYASLVNGGLSVEPVFTVEETQRQRPVISAETSRVLRRYMQRYVEIGVGVNAAGEDFLIGGSGSTADMRDPNGQYNDDRHVSTFVGVFPIEAPRFVVAVLLEDPERKHDGDVYRTSGWTVAPVVGELIDQVGDALLEK